MLVLQTEANKKQPLPKKISAELDIKRVILLGDTFFIRPGSNPQAIEDWAGAPLAKLLLAQRSAVNKQIAQDLRRSQVKRITSQQAPDGQIYTARKKRKNLWGKIGRIKRQEAAMFTKLRKQKSLKILQDANQWQRDSTEAWRVLPGSSFPRASMTASMMRTTKSYKDIFLIIMKPGDVVRGSGGAQSTLGP